MNSKDTITGECDCSLDAAAYVLGALEQDELEAFRAHLAECSACREEVAALQPVADTLPAAVPVIAPPPDLRRRVLDAVRAEEESASTSTSMAAERRPARPRRRLSFTSPWPAAGLGAVVAAAAAAIVAIAIGSGGSSPTTRVIQADVTGAGSAKMILTGGHAELVVEHFPAAGSGRIYEVWLERPHSAPAPTRTLFNVTTSGGGEVGVVGNLHGVSEVLVTAEPLGGTAHPTTAPVITARI